MKDARGNIIHIGDIVTLNLSARPRTIIGYYGRVTGLGDVRIKIAPLEESSRSITDETRVLPSMLVVGIHDIKNPAVYNHKFRTVIADAVGGYLDDYFYLAVEKGIIDANQVMPLKDLFNDEMNQINTVGRTVE